MSKCSSPKCEWLLGSAAYGFFFFSSGAFCSGFCRHSLSLFSKHRTMNSIKGSPFSSIPSNHWYNQFNEGMIEDVSKRVSENAEKGEYSLLFIDDAVNRLKTLQDPLSNLMLTNRHKKLAVWILAQDFMKVLFFVIHPKSTEKNRRFLSPYNWISAFLTSEWKRTVFPVNFHYDVENVEIHILLFQSFCPLLYSANQGGGGLP